MVSFFYNRILFYVELVLFAAVLIVIGWRLRRMKKDIGRYLRRIAGSLNQSEQDALSAFPLPVMVSAVNGEIIWYNDLFRHQVLDGNELFGESVGVPTGGATMGELQKKKFIDVSYAGRRYTVYISPVRVREATLYVLYYVDDTQLKEIAEEYALSRPAVMMVYIDNIEELMQNIRDSERAQLSGRWKPCWRTGFPSPPVSCGNSAPITLWWWWSSVTCKRSSKAASIFWIGCGPSRQGII